MNFILYVNMAGYCSDSHILTLKYSKNLAIQYNDNTSIYTTQHNFQFLIQRFLHHLVDIYVIMYVTI